MQHNKSYVLQQFSKIIPVITNNKIEILIEIITMLLKSNFKTYHTLESISNKMFNMLLCFNYIN